MLEQPTTFPVSKSFERNPKGEMRGTFVEVSLRHVAGALDNSKAQGIVWDANGKVVLMPSRVSWVLRSRASEKCASTWPQIAKNTVSK